jgi:hypothetical protein
MDLRDIAAALKGHVFGGQVLAPGPGHSPKDRSLSVRLNAEAGFLVHSFAGQAWRDCLDHVERRLGLHPRRRTPSLRRYVPFVRQGREALDKRALWLWRRRLAIEGTLAERYLREARCYFGPLPNTLGFLPASGEHPPSMIAAFGLADERETGALAIDDRAVRGVHVTRLTPDGSARIGKATIGRGSAGSPIVLAPPNDLLGLEITEGIEDALSIYAATELGVWAAGSAGRMPPLAAEVPSWIEVVNVFGHDDPAGRHGAIELAVALRARGFEVLLKFLGAGQSG